MNQRDVIRDAVILSLDRPAATWVALVFHLAIWSTTIF